MTCAEYSSMREIICMRDSCVRKSLPYAQITSVRIFFLYGRLLLRKSLSCGRLFCTDKNGRLFRMKHSSMQSLPFGSLPHGRAQCTETSSLRTNPPYGRVFRANTYFLPKTCLYFRVPPSLKKTYCRHRPSHQEPVERGGRFPNRNLTYTQHGPSLVHMSENNRAKQHRCLPNISHGLK